MTGEATGKTRAEGDKWQAGRSTERNEQHPRVGTRAGAAPTWASRVLLAWLPASFILRDPGILSWLLS